MADKVLYFPYMRVPENRWFTRVLLYWDQIGSIVPSEYADRPEGLGRYMGALVKEEQVKPIKPGTYIHRIPNFAEPFLKMIDDNPLIKGRRGIALKEHETFTLHIEKFSPLVYGLEDMGLARETSSPWWEMESLTADLYMTYLSSALGKTEDLNMEPITDRSQSLSMYSASSENISKPADIFRDLRMRVIQGILPAPTGGIPVLDLVQFKTQNHDLLHRFRRHIESSLINIARTPDEALRIKEAQMFEEELREQREEILALMRRRRWPKIAFGAVAAAMLDDHHIAITALDAAVDHLAVAGGLNGGTSWSGVVHPFVGADGVQDRMFPAQAKARTDARKLHRGAQEGLAHAMTVGGIVVSVIAGICITYGLIRLASIAEGGRDNVAVTDLFAVEKNFFVNHSETVALANIQGEIDIPTEDTGQFHGEFV